MLNVEPLAGTGNDLSNNGENVFKLTEKKIVAKTVIGFTCSTVSYKAIVLCRFTQSSAKFPEHIGKRPKCFNKLFIR